jgi:hypothetical protein
MSESIAMKRSRTDLTETSNEPVNAEIKKMLNQKAESVLVSLIQFYDYICISIDQT